MNFFDNVGRNRLKNLVLSFQRLLQAIIKFKGQTNYDIQLLG